MTAVAVALAARPPLVCISRRPGDETMLERLSHLGIGLALSPRHAQMAALRREGPGLVIIDPEMAHVASGAIRIWRERGATVVLVDPPSLDIIRDLIDGHQRRTMSIRLTGREQQVLTGIGHGLTNDEIAEQLGIGSDTVKTHARRIYDKLGARDRPNAVLCGVRAGFLR